MPVLCQGERIEGVGRCYDSNSKSVMWDHALVSSALVQLGEDPYLLRCDPFPDALMSTGRYPRLTATEAMLNVAGDAVTAGAKVKALRVDAEFTTRYAHSFLPTKATKHHPLSYKEKCANRTLARLRLHIERVICESVSPRPDGPSSSRLKVFRILEERYCGRRKRFGLRFNLIAGIHNFELCLNP